MCLLREMKADYDLVSEIIKLNRRSRETVNCAGLYEYILGPLAAGDLAPVKASQIILPLLANVEAARIRAQGAYLKWMEYMTRVVWGLFSFLFSSYDNGLLLCIRYQIRGRQHEVLEKVPSPFGWITLVPSRPLFGEIPDVPYSWNEPGWDIGPAMNLGTAWE